MKKTIIIVLFLSVVFAALSFALSVDEIVTKTNNAAYYAGDDGKATIKMAIVDKQGRTRNREMVILRRDIEDGADQNYYIYFKRPADVRKMSYLVWKHITKDDDRWLYLPALDLVKRIAASDKRTSFAGSDFFYEDVSGRSIDEDTHELVKTTDEYYILKNTPKNPGEVEFSSFTMYVDKNTFLPAKVEFLDKKGELYRLYEVLESKEIQGHHTPTITKMTDLKSGGHSTIEFSDIVYDNDMDESVFSERYLRKPPRELVK